jgi:hypothetical protein
LEENDKADRSFEAPAISVFILHHKACIIRSVISLSTPHGSADALRKAGDGLRFDDRGDNFSFYQSRMIINVRTEFFRGLTSHLKTFES